MAKVNKTVITALVTGLFVGTLHNGSSAEPNNNAKGNITNTTVMPEKNNTIPSEQVAPKILNIGDSRTVGMYFAENIKKYSNTVDAADAKGNLWFAKVGQGYKWFENNLGNIKNRAQDCDVVVINLGVNDLASSGSSQTVAQKYIRCLNNLASDWAKQGKKVFFSASNPVGPQYRGSHVFNQKIDSFNKAIKDGLSSDITFIDTNSYIKGKLQAKDFDSYGLHYNASINRDIHKYIETRIAQKLSKTNQNTMAWRLQKQND